MILPEFTPTPPPPTHTYSGNYQFISLVKTWLQNHIHDHVINIEGYNLTRIFPDSEMEELEEVSLQSASLDEAAELMLNKLGNDDDEPMSIEDFVEMFAKRNSSENVEHEFVIVDRESFWIDVIRL